MKARNWLAAIVFVALAAAAGNVGAAGGAGQEVMTAIQHAGYSAGSDSVEKQQLHLHHVVNCLVGEQGEGFDAAAGNPCKGQGSGAINDAPEGSQARMLIEQAAALARLGTKNPVALATKHVALAVEETLKQADAELK